MVVVASMTPSKAWDTLLADSQRYWSEDSEWRVAILAADARIKELEEELEDIKSGFRNVVNGLCAGDEKHCACVYPLRARIKQLEEAIGMMLKLYDESDWYNDTVVDECRRRAGR
jgi:hypothetical protein